MANLPVFTDAVNQQFFIEAQGGSKQPISYLDRFPDAVYSKALDSVLVTFMYALLGPVGAGLLRQEYLEARLAFEEAGLSGADLDTLYTNPFAFARLADETYDIDAAANLIPAQDRAAILASDAAFRNRAISFLRGLRAGGTLAGLTLVARSGLNHPVELVENYRALYDQYCDYPLGLPYLGTTTNLNEVIVLPRQDVPQSAQQTLTLQGEPISGWFTLTLPLGPLSQTAQVTVVNGSSIITVPDAAQCPPGTFVTIPGTPTVYAQAGFAQTPTSIQLVYPLSAGPSGTNTGTPGQPYPMTIANSTYQAYFGNSQTGPLPYNATYGQIQTALWALPIVANNDVVVTGGPFPNQPIVVRFKGQLADQSIPAIEINLQPDSITGIGSATAAAPLVSQLADVNRNSLTISGNVSVNIAGTASDADLVNIPPSDEHVMQIALDQIRPAISFFSTRQAQGVTHRQPTNTIFAGSAYAEVLRYVKGLHSIQWPPIQGNHWIEAGVEHEAPHPVADRQHSYKCFHNVLNVYAYTENALTDSAYEIPGNVPPVWVRYYNTHTGNYSEPQITLYPFLRSFQGVGFEQAIGALATPPNPRVVTTVNGQGLINGEYPVDYLGLIRPPKISSKMNLWGSTERNSGTDYLEIDLGSVQAVNYLYFEATNKPYQITASYDVLDMTPNRHFVPVTMVDPRLAPSVTSLTYNATATNPWTVVELHFANSLRQMIYTRYIRLEFKRTPNHSPLINSLGQVSPYSVEVRNLRLGRNVA